MSTTHTTVLDVTGMTCGHCVSAVTKELNELPDVTDVRVELRSDEASTVTVTSSAPLGEDAAREAIDEAGYDITGFRA